MKLLLLLLAITIVVARQSPDLPGIHGPIADVTDVAYFVDEPGPKHKTMSGKHITSFSEMQLTPYMDAINGISKRHQGFIKGPLTDVTDLRSFSDKPGPKHKSISGKHIDSFSEVHLTPYMDIISGIPVARRQPYQNIIPYRKRMQAQRGMLRSAMKGKMQTRGSSAWANRLPMTSSRSFVDERSELSSWGHLFGQKEVLNKRMSVPDAVRRKWWKRSLGFRSKPEAELPGSLGSQFYIMVYGKRERSFPGNRLPIAQFLTANKRDQLKGIPKTGAPIRQFLIPADRDLQSATLFKSLPNIILAVNNKIHDKIFRTLDPNVSEYPPVNEGIEERLYRPLRPIM